MGGSGMPEGRASNRAGRGEMRRHKGLRRGLRAAAAAAGAAALLTPLAANATEGGQYAFATGVNTVLPAIHPQPGETRYFNYLLDYTAGETTNLAGAQAIPHFRLQNVVNAARVLHTWTPTYDHFSFTSGFVVPFIDSRVEAGAKRKQIFGVGDASLQNFVNWNNPSKTLFLAGGLDIFLPTGRYNPLRMVNTSLHKTTFAPEGDVTWFITKEVEVSASTVFEDSTTNTATHYASGNDQETDWSVEFTHPKLKWAHFGLNGFYYSQLSPDHRAGVLVPNSTNQEILSLGPQLRFDYGRSGIVLKWQHEMEAHNRPEGDRLWIQFTVPLSPQKRSAPPAAPASEK